MSWRGGMPSPRKATLLKSRSSKSAWNRSVEHTLPSSLFESMCLNPVRHVTKDALHQSTTGRGRGIESRNHVSRRVKDGTEAGIAFGARVELIDGVDRVMDAIHRLARTPGGGFDLRGDGWRSGGCCPFSHVRTQ